MSTAIGEGDVLQVRLEYRAGDTVAYNILHYEFDDLTVIATGLPPATFVPFEDLVGSILTEVANHFRPDWQAIASNTVQYTGVTVQSIHPAPRSRPYTGGLLAPASGEVIDEALPLQDSVTILKRSPVGERWGLGRAYVVGLPESSQVGGVLAAGLVPFFTAFADKFAASIPVVAPLYSFDLDPILFARLEGGDVRKTPITDAALSNDTLKTQRRRRPGKGI